MVLPALNKMKLRERWFIVVGAKTLLIAFASLVGLVSVGAVAAAQQDRDTGPSAPVSAIVAQDAGTGDAVTPVESPTDTARAVSLVAMSDPASPAVTTEASGTGSGGADELADVVAAAPTTGGLSVTYRSDTGGSITTVVLAEGGTVVSSAILQSAVAHRFELPAGTYQVDVVHESGLVTQGDVATSSASAVRSAPVEVTGGSQVDLYCAFSGCEVR